MPAAKQMMIIKQIRNQPERRLQRPNRRAIRLDIYRPKMHLESNRNPLIKLPLNQQVHLRRRADSHVHK
jgi:hypothetical protein